MDWVKNISKYKDWFTRFKFPLLILALGLALLLIPAGAGEKPQEEVISPEGENILSMEDELSQILSMIQGAGKVQVMLTHVSGEEVLYQTDITESSGDSSNNLKEETVTVTNGDREETGLVRQINPPAYLGAIVVCQGADSPSVRLGIVEAVSKITGLGSDRISVLKMK